MSIGRSGPPVRNAIGGMPPGPGLRDGWVNFVTAMLPATSKEMKDDITQVSMGCISECGKLSSVREAQKYALNA